MRYTKIARGALGVLSCALLVGLFAVPLQAQQQQQNVPDLEEETIETFAEAYLEISDVRMDLQASLQNAQDDQQASQLQQQANQEMQAILEDHDMNVQEYQEITQVLNNDPEQRQEFEQVVEELREEEGTPGQPG